MKQLSDAAIEVLANWWFDRFLNTHHDNGGREVQNIIANKILNDIAQSHEVLESQRQPFIDALQSHGCKRDLGGLGTDYHPGYVLAEAMTKAGIDHSRASIKTCVVVSSYGVAVSAGYRAEWETLCDLDGKKP